MCKTCTLKTIKYLFRSLLISFINILQFSVYKSCTSFVRFISKYFFNIYLFYLFSLFIYFLIIFGYVRSQLQHMGSSLRHEGSFCYSTWSLRCGAWASLVVVCGLLPSCGTRAPEHMGSVVCSTQALSLRCTSSIVGARRLSCPRACGILVPQPEMEPMPPALESGFFTTGPPGKSLCFDAMANGITYLILISDYLLRV